MNTVTVVELIREALLTTFWLSLPLLGVGFIVGIVMSLIQIVTSIQDPSFSTVPRLLGFLAAILALMPWMLNRSMTYTIQLFSDFARYAS
jgi:flagellar biosynthetic protein FliQ